MGVEREQPRSFAMNPRFGILHTRLSAQLRSESRDHHTFPCFPQLRYYYGLNGIAENNTPVRLDYCENTITR